MGDPKKLRKTYKTPPHPWIKEKIDEEKILTREYGLKNKREIWKMESILKRFRDQAKNLTSLNTPQAEKEKELMLLKIQKLGLIKDTTSLDPVLDLTLRDILERRLQTQVFKKGLAKTTKQARQFIIHKLIVVDNKKMTVPSYIVSVKEESLLAFSPNCKLNDPEHPERIVIKEEPAEIEKSDKKSKPKKEKNDENKEDKKGKQKTEVKKESTKVKEPVEVNDDITTGTISESEEVNNE